MICFTISLLASVLQGGGGGGERGLFGDLLGAAFQVVTAELVSGRVGVRE